MGIRVSEENRSVCRRCGGEVVANAESFDVFEQMHYTCFHYEFEHAGDPDIECTAGGCPAAGISVASLHGRIGDIEMASAGNTIVPAILTLRRLHFDVTQDADRWVARLGRARFVADDPVTLLGLIKLAENRTPWRATDSEIDDVLAEFDL
ncbi:hypothetical protein [Cellulomonas xiejunii]|uniref:hypothetical protein n=1 Tax=Cellulomonas xiejunii TaxID=2968083 RepID=UPI001D0DD646|nr:hypothetical protein [Cellulomonas xiejunii]MCC2316053.1 hypothetical protein [Cellulomonas xiejunii]